MNFSHWVGFMVDANYNQMGINSATLSGIGFPGGNTNVFSATLDPIIHLTPRSHFDLYVIGGGGYYRREIEFTAPTIVGFTGYNPFFGFYSAAVPTNAVVSSYSVNKPGVDIGAGIALGTKWHGSSSRRPGITASSLTARRAWTIFLPRLVSVGEPALLIGARNSRAGRRR